MRDSFSTFLLNSGFSFIKPENRISSACSMEPVKHVELRICKREALQKFVFQKAAISLFVSDENEEVSPAFEKSRAGTSCQ